MPQPKELPLVIATAGVVVVKGDAVLLVRHDVNAAHLTGAYGIPAGRIDDEESPLDTALRELYEETGLRTEPGFLIELPTLYMTTIRQKHGTFVFSLRAYACSSILGEVGQSSEGTPEWIPIEEVAGLSLIGDTERIVRDAVSLIAAHSP